MYTLLFRSVFNTGSKSVQENGSPKPMSTTGKIKVLAGAKKEAKLFFMNEIVVTKYSSEPHPNLILKLDQTLSKYVPPGRHAAKECKSVPIAGSADKCSITATLISTLN